MRLGFLPLLAFVSLQSSQSGVFVVGGGPLGSPVAVRFLYIALMTLGFACANLWCSATARWAVSNPRALAGWRAARTLLANREAPSLVP